MLKDKNIVIGVTGCIAAYKVCEVINRLKREGANVFVIMTRHACEFITPLTLQTLSKNAVVTDMFEKTINYEVEHISLATKADLFLVVPATANIIGKVANGIADDMLSTTIMATTSPVIFAPAMNVNMYENEFVKSNIEKLKKHSYIFIEPVVGMLACGVEAVGKLASPKDIVNVVIDTVKKGF
jgi:phosphopantothenoylcysteine decarboxylase/phosphopantothenate--cysteine ligase